MLMIQRAVAFVLHLKRQEGDGRHANPLPFDFHRDNMILGTSLSLPESNLTILLTSTKWFSSDCREFSHAILALLITFKKFLHSSYRQYGNP